MTHSSLGSLHLTAALLAMLLGALVVLRPKGSLRHKQVGYGYVLSMLVVNGTALQIYYLSGHFGVFHGLALLSLAAIAGGILPALLRHRIKHWLHWHYYFTAWSVVGLYTAFWAETLTRLLPMQLFWPVVAVASALTGGLGSYWIRRYAARLLPSDQEG